MAWRHRSNGPNPLFAAALVMAGAVIVFAAFLDNDRPQPADAAVEDHQPRDPVKLSRLSPIEEIAWIRANKNRVSERLRDPASARFSEVRVSYTSGAPVVCGYVNAKNAMGGYAGTRRFFSGGDTLGTHLDGETPDFETLWRGLC